MLDEDVLGAAYARGEGGARGAQPGELMGIAPTGKRVTFKGISMARLADGKIEEIWENHDALGMMQQLGVVSFPEEAQT